MQVTNASAEQIADALLSEGVVLLRGLLDAEMQDRFLRFAEHSPLEETGTFVYLTEMELISGWLPLSVRRAMALLFKRAPISFNTSCAVRTASIGNNQSYLYYHQDITPIGIMGINLWAALDAIDGTRPGLEMLVRRQHKALAPIATPGHASGIPPYRIPDDAVRGVFPDSDFVAPRMDKGDGMMFLFSTIHRTYLTPEMTNSRRSIELRFV